MSNGKWEEIVAGHYGKYLHTYLDTWKIYELRDQKNGKYGAVNKYCFFIRDDDIDALKRKIKETIGAASFRKQE